MKKSITVITAMLLATTAYAGEFTAMDTDADGVISEVEFVAAYPDADKTALEAADLDKNGSLDEAEVIAATQAGILPAE
jgi:Ca2+-binding EF-hand superfamily protein